MAIRKPREQQSSAHRIWDAMRAVLHGPHAWIVMIAVWIGVNAIVLFWPKDTIDKRHYETIARIWTEVTAINQENATIEDWDALVTKYTAELEHIIDELEEDASPRYPAKQHLLWASRDCLVPLLRGRSFDPEKFLGHMATARRHIRQAGQDVPELTARNNGVTGAAQ